MQLGFDCRQVEPSDPNRFEPLPPGWYTGIIIASEQKLSKNTPGAWYLALTYQIVDGPDPKCKNRQLFLNLNLGHPNATTKQIAQEQLSAIGYATGQIQIPDSNVLHNIPHLISVKKKPAEGNYPESNEIKGWKSREDTPRPGAGIGGNAAGVPQWGQNQPPPVQQQYQPAPNVQQAQVEPAPPPPASTHSSGSGFGNVPAPVQQQPVATSQPAAGGPPEWARPRK